ncbi:MAG TPA: PKD domain-containing protein, partial [Candidatus Dormibacteraeota bacterium]|nr:PKD domain-containing protein [Candidatus Dormibacteraeota bacterium]
MSVSLLLASAFALAAERPVHPAPASDAFFQWLEIQRTKGPPAFADPQAVTAGLALAEARAGEMRAIMEQDPAAFIERSIPATLRKQLPASIQQHIEHRVTARGSFRAYCAGLPIHAPNQVHPAPRSGYAFEVTIGQTNYRAFVFGKWRDERPVLDATIEGLVLDDAIAIGDSPTPTEQAASGQLVSSSTPSTTGPNTMLYMVARFSDQTNDPISDSTVLSQMAVVSNFWMNCSGGSVYLRGRVNSNQVVDIVHITLPQPASYGATFNNNFAQLLSDARTAASAQGYSYANYNLDVVVSTSGGFSYAGRSYIGSQGSHWVTPYTTLRTAGHELGHNLGLYHANYWRTDSTQPFGEDSNPGGYVADYFDGEWVEYGHYFSVMSAQYGSEWDDATKPIYNPVEKVQLGWLSGSQAQYVSTSGTYRLYRHDARSTVGVPRGIRIETPATDYTSAGHHYWLGYRYAPWGIAQNWYQNGVEVDVCQTGYGSDGSIELDMSPFSKDQTSPFYDATSPPGNWWTIDNSDKQDGALVVGRTYDDSAAGIHITPISTGNNGAGEEFIDMVINLGSFPGNHAPSITSFTASTNQVGTGQTVTFNVAAADADGDTVAFSWDFDEGQVWTASGLNSPSATRSWSTPGQYRVKVTLSDMKGGVTTASQIVNVGAAANTAQIWGRVVWAGQPVYGARVSTSVGGQTWTDTDGSYVLTDLIPGSSYVVNCQAAGLTFTAQFANPVSLAQGNAFAMDFYANESLPGAGGTTFNVSGQVT